jgi:hypothetical protein
MTSRLLVLSCVLVAVPTLAEAQFLAGGPKPLAPLAEPDTQALRSRARSLLGNGDVAAARLFLKRASDMGDKQAATELSALPEFGRNLAERTGTIAPRKVSK